MKARCIIYTYQNTFTFSFATTMVMFRMFCCFISCTKIRPSAPPPQVVETGKKVPASPPPPKVAKTEKKKPRPSPRPPVKASGRRKRFGKDAGGVAGCGGGCGGGC
ncbi:PHD finger protein ALFIN-LIKE 9-like [Brassica napus]|nr:PREDICTED: PHD finger protein ALFIN-LIKE 9-like [Brassica oleracea var. oleracea]XP_013647121.2 PHD finger protein ALFIN-LIKE 9-like [Brassica napus]